MEFAIIIPARYKSSRFPGKPLAMIKGTPLIKRVWDICIKAVPKEQVFVATDDNRIQKYCINNNMNVLLTSESCLTGTDRVYEASLQIDADLYINVQGDEPTLNPRDISLIASQATNADVVNAMCSITNESDFMNPNVPKVVTRLDGKLLYMSRAGVPSNKTSKFVTAMKQVCIYAFSKKALHDFYHNRKKTPLEEIEDIEILRFLELGYDVHMVKVSSSSLAVDIPEDILKVEEYLNSKNP